MKILAVDTSTSVAAVALSDDHKLIAEQIENTKMTHSAKLMTMVDQILHVAEIDIADVDVFAVATGPGSFTGLRIGIAAVKGLAAVHQKQIAAISTLENLANNFLYCTKLVCPLLDARNRQVYAAAYDTQSGIPVETIEIASYPIENFIKRVKAEAQDVLFLGNAAYLYEDLIKEKLGNRAVFAPESALEQRASTLCSIARRYAKENKLHSYAEVIPTYYKASQPEREE